MSYLNKSIYILIPTILITQFFGIRIFNRKSANKEYEIAKNITKINQSKLDHINQLIVVFNDASESSDAILVALEKKDSTWNVKFGPMKTGIGKNGFAFPDTKQEGDGKSPTGLFRLGQLFSYESKVNTQLPFIQTTTNDKWIDDPESADYNKYIRGETSAKSYEKLLIGSDAYKYCMVIEYNTNPIVKGKGSAIFFHLGNEATSGCVTISEKEMKQILHWMLPGKNPCIIMGNKDVLLKGL